MEQVHNCGNCAHFEACDFVMKRYADGLGMNKEGPACGHYVVRLEDILGKDYDLEHLRELLEADGEGRVKIHPKPDDRTCGSCGNFRRIKGRRCGTCAVRSTYRNRYGTDEPQYGTFTPSQSRKACKQYVPVEGESDD